MEDQQFCACGKPVLVRKSGLCRQCYYKRYYLQHKNLPKKPKQEKPLPPYLREEVQEEADGLNETGQS